MHRDSSSIRQDTQVCFGFVSLIQPETETRICCAVLSLFLMMLMMFSSFYFQISHINSELRVTFNESVWLLCVLCVLSALSNRWLNALTPSRRSNAVAEARGRNSREPEDFIKMSFTGRIFDAMRAQTETEEKLRAICRKLQKMWVSAVQLFRNNQIQSTFRDV